MEGATRLSVNYVIKGHVTYNRSNTFRVFRLTQHSHTCSNRINTP